MMTSAWRLDRDLVHAITRSPPVRPSAQEARSFETAESTELTTLNIAQLAQLAGTSQRDLRLLVDYGLLELTDPEREPWTFSVVFLPTLRRAQQMREELNLSVDGWALAMNLLLEIDRLEVELRVAAESRTILDPRALDNGT
jgi:hypothetical protein